MSKQLSLDVISDILSRLPAKSLLRFKCVSKPWCFLISSSDFITLHLKNSPNIRSNHSLILRHCDLLSVDLTTLDHAVVLDHPLKDSGGGTEVFGSCNGLLCLSNSEEEIAFWNFSTRKFRKLPVTQIEFPDYFTACQYIIYGFGYDSLNNDYKLVRIIQFFGEDYDSFDNEVKVYSLRANSWRRIAHFPYYMRYKRAWGVLVNEALHWVVSRKPESDVENLIVAFHVGSEECVEVPKPNFGDNDFHMNVGVLGGCLCVLSNYYQVHFDVWVMNEYGVESSWVKLFSIAQPMVIRSFEYIIPLVYSKSGREVLLNQDGEKFIRYDLKSGRVKNVRICGVPDSFEVEVCMGSLVPLDGDGGFEGELAKRKKKNRKRNKKKRDDFLPMGSKLVPEFQMEVIANILSRLPAKTLLRFKCVSKPWHTLIDGPDFVKMHLKHSIERSANHSLILRGCYLYSVNFDSFDKAIELNHPLKTPYYGTEVLGSCNGLLCLYNSEEDVVLWNPSTGKYQKIPVAPIQFPSDFAWCQYIIYGFGYDLINDDYKIVRIVQFYGMGDVPFDSEVKVYSLKRNLWRKIQKCPYYLRYKRGWGLFANGALHWVVTRRPDMDTSNIVVALDLGIEQYREVPQPNFVDKSFHMNLAVLGGSLCILSNYHKVRVDIWVMKDYGVKESWTKLFSIAQPRVIRSFEYVRPVAYSNTGNEVLLEQDNKKLLWYDLKRDKVKNIKVHGMPDSFDAEICVGSLVALSGDTGIVGKKQQSQEKKKGKKRDDFLSEGFKLVL